MKARSDVRMEEMSVLVNLEVASFVKIESCGGSRSSDEGADALANSKMCLDSENSFPRSAD